MVKRNEMMVIIIYYIFFSLQYNLIFFEGDSWVKYHLHLFVNHAQTHYIAVCSVFFFITTNLFVPTKLICV